MCNLFRNGQLSDTPFQSWLAKDNSINSLFDTVASTQVPLLSQILEQLEVPVLANIGHIQRSNGIVFESNRRWSDMQIRGNAELSLMVQPKSDNLHMVAYLYDMNPLGVGKMITHKPLTVHDTTPGETLRVDGGSSLAKEVMVPLQRHDKSVPFDGLHLAADLPDIFNEDTDA